MGRGSEVLFQLLESTISGKLLAGIFLKDQAIVKKDEVSRQDLNLHWLLKNVALPYDPTIPLLGIYQEKTIIQKDTCLRRAQGGQKPPVEQKGKSSLDLDFQYEYRPWKRGLMKKKKDTCTSMFITALFTIARTWKQPKCLSTEEWIKKYVVHIYNGILFIYKKGMK